MGYLDAFPAANLPPLPTSPVAAASASTVPGSGVPLRAERRHCWAARDAFFACLDAHGIIDAVRDPAGVTAAQAQCGHADAVLRRDCAASWVTYFKERRVMEHKKQAMLQGLEKEGAQPLGGQLPGVPSASSVAARP